MAVVNKWVNADLESGKLANAALVSPSQIFALAGTFEVAAADDDGSIYKIATLGSNLIPLAILINNDAITAGTDYDLGLYNMDGVTEVNKDLFADGIDLSSAHIFGSELDGLITLGIEKMGLKMYELAGHTIATKLEQYILALTANTVGTAAGTVSYRAYFLQG